MEELEELMEFAEDILCEYEDPQEKRKFKLNITSNNKIIYEYKTPEIMDEYEYVPIKIEGVKENNYIINLSIIDPTDKKDADICLNKLKKRLLEYINKINVKVYVNTD